ncbi:MAG TPA: ABC transporter ATP-binding protein [Planococcus sp. (in: firmicutes)]|nr:ABC transporter ATP-binding protein [Planococcus sp. (in: firmicutes)]
MSDLRIINIEKQYRQTRRKGDAVFSLKPVDLTIREGEFFSLLGPSGCGKTTLLKLVAGLIDTDNGEIWIGDSNLTAVPPEARRFAMVFQQSLLFPHMTVEDNTAFGLKMQKVGKQERLTKAQEMLGHVGLEGFGSRFPHELSGGQQQRVALARALVTNPRVLLMDEPFSALDPSLREEMRELLRKIQQQLGLTVLFVTHDREEAFYLSDRIGIMSDGALLQVGSAKDLYERPVSTKVASFLGVKNIIEGTVANGRFLSADQYFVSAVQNPIVEGNCYMILRPEALQLESESTEPQRGIMRVIGVLQELRFNNGFYTGKVQTGTHLLECTFSGRQAEKIPTGKKIDLMLDMKDVWFVEK